MGKSGGKLLIYGVVLFALLYSLVKILIVGTPIFFRLELFGLLFLVACIFIGFLMYDKWGEHLFFFVFVLYLGNLAVIWFSGRSFHLLLALVTVFGIVLSVPRKVHVNEMPLERPKVEVVDIDPKVLHSPGKFVASKRSNIYHTPKCEWAKKIKTERRMWFKSKEDAWEKGLKKHQCVE
tara:strand:+ start:82334 stop:82870 length:537 start_codon:yes stop_codon:yes gene_type:complete